MEDNAEREVVQVKKLADLAIKTVTIEYDPGDGFPVYKIPVKMLSYTQWSGAEREVPRPTAPVSHAGPKGKVYDFNDPAYVQAVGAWTEKVALRRLLLALDIEIDGETDDEKLAALEEGLGAGVVQTVYRVLQQYHGVRMAQVENRASTFHKNGSK